MFIQRVDFREINGDLWDSREVNKDYFGLYKDDIVEIKNRAFRIIRRDYSYENEKLMLVLEEFNQ